MSNVERPDEFRQVCVWPGVTVGEEDGGFEEFMLKNFNARVVYLEEVETFPDRDEGGACVEGTGGRNDLFFAVPRDDIGGFAVPRLGAGIRWLEDVLAPVNGGAALYPERVKDYQVWPITEGEEE